MKQTTNYKWLVAWYVRGRWKTMYVLVLLPRKPFFIDKFKMCITKQQLQPHILDAKYLTFTEVYSVPQQAFTLFIWSCWWLQEYNCPNTSTCLLLVEHPDHPPAILSASVQATAAHTNHPFPCMAVFVGDCI